MEKEDAPLPNNTTPPKPDFKSMSVDETMAYFESKGAKRGNKTGAFMMPLSKGQADTLRAQAKLKEETTKVEAIPKAETVPNEEVKKSWSIPIKPWIRWIIVIVGFVPLMSITQYLCRFVVLGLYRITFPIEGILEFGGALFSVPMIMAFLSLYFYSIILFIGFFAPNRKIASMILLTINGLLVLAAYVIPSVIDLVMGTNRALPIPWFNVSLDVIMLFALICTPSIDVNEIGG